MEKLGPKVSFDHQWAGDVMDFKAGAMGASVGGKAVVYDDRVDVEVELPWMLKAFAPKVQDKIRKEGTLLLAKK